MSGDNIVIDSSLIINLFNGEEKILSLIEGRNLFVSVISEIEVLSFAGLKQQERQILRDFLDECFVVDLDPHIKDLTISIRSKSKMKLPDAIIAATAIYFDLPLFTMDKGFNRLENLNAVIIS